MTTPGSNGPDQPSGGGAPGWGQPPAGPPGGYAPPPPPPGGGFPGQYPAQGQQPYPPQGQPYPPQGQPYPPQGGAPGQPWAPQKSRRPKWLIPVIAGVVALLAVGGLFLFLNGSKFEVGDCLHQKSASEVEQVDCDDSDADARVIGIHDEELTQSDYYSDDSTCSDFPETVSQVWVENTFGDKGTIYCLAPVG